MSHASHGFGFVRIAASFANSFGGTWLIQPGRGLTGAAPTRERLVDPRYAHQKHRCRRVHRHSPIRRRQNTITQVLRTGSTTTTFHLAPGHSSPQTMDQLPAHFGSDADSNQGEFALAWAPMHKPIQRRAVLATLVALAPRALAAEPAGEVASSRGECYALTADARRDLTPATAVFVGDAVGTGAQSALGLRLGTATEVRLGAEARLRIDRFLVNAGGTLVLERGAMLYDHDAANGPSEVSVRGTFGLIAVRGTRFFAGPSNGMFGVFVMRGAVTVMGGQTAVLVVSGHGTDIVQPGAKPTHPHEWGKARMEAAMASIR